jgi:hypothetical protein
MLAYLANPERNRRVFGLPLPGTFGYYFSEYFCLLMASERWARRDTPQRE